MRTGIVAWTHTSISSYECDTAAPVSSFGGSAEVRLSLFDKYASDGGFDSLFEITDPAAQLRFFLGVDPLTGMSIRGS
jgi:hypothetical protein